MKKIILPLLLIIGIFLITSCYDPIPSICFNILKDKDTLFCDTTGIEDSVVFRISISHSPENLAKSILICDETSQLEYFELNESEINIVKFYIYKVPNNIYNDTIINLFIEICDQYSNCITERNSITILKKPSNLPEIITIENSTVNYNSYYENTELMWYITDNNVEILQNNDDKGDLVYFFSGTYYQQILSPNSQAIENHFSYIILEYCISTKKETKIQKVEESLWETANDDIINDLEVVSNYHIDGGVGIENVQLGEVFAFELSDGRKGLFKVVGSNSPFKTSKISSSITLDFKFQNKAFIEEN